MKHGKCVNNYFDIEQHESFTLNSTTDECWFCDREVIMAYFLEVVVNLVDVDIASMKKSTYAMQK